MELRSCSRASSFYHWAVSPTPIFVDKYRQPKVHPHIQPKQPHLVPWLQSCISGVRGWKRLLGILASVSIRNRMLWHPPVDSGSPWDRSEHTRTSHLCSCRNAFCVSVQLYRVKATQSRRLPLALFSLLLGLKPSTILVSVKETPRAKMFWMYSSGLQMWRFPTISYFPHVLSRKRDVPAQSLECLRTAQITLLLHSLLEGGTGT